MKNFSKSFGIIAFAAVIGLLVPASAFAQNVGDTVQVSGQNYRVTEVSGDRLVLQKAQGGYQIGDTGPGGGIIFYHNPAGFTVQMPNTRDNYTAYYLEVAPENLGGIYGAKGTLIRGVTTASSDTSQELNTIGNGRKDTATLVAEFARMNNVRNTAAQNAAAYRGGGKDDWFLPSMGELQEMLKQRAYTNMGSSRYRSSTQMDADRAWVLYITYNRSSIEHRDKSESSSSTTRAIRAF